MLIINGKIITHSEILSGQALLVRDGRIVAVGPLEGIKASENDPVMDAGGCYVAPGFIDIHVHGGAGCDTMDGHVESLAKIARFHATGGTTGFVPTTVSAPAADIAKVIETVATARDHDFGGAEILGLHVEGPYINPSRAGCHDPSQLRLPNAEEYGAWLERDDVITHFTLAPELDGAMDLIEKLAEHEIIPCAGHTEAGEDVARLAVERGLCHATHLFNCMSSMTKRGAVRVAGFAEAALANDNITVELVADGKHLPPAVMRMAIKAKGVDQVCLVTDATAGAGLQDGEEFSLGATRGVVSGGVGLTSDKSHLAGSTSQMISLVRTLVTAADISLVDAVRMASLTPARVLGISGKKGSLDKRKDADIVLFDDSFSVRQTIIGGHIVYDAAAVSAQAS